MAKKTWELKLQGVDDLKKTFAQLKKDSTDPEGVLALGVLDVLTEMAKPILDTAKATVRRRSGKTADGLIIGKLSPAQHRAEDRKYGDVIVHAGSKPQGPAIPLEYGTAPRKTKKGKSTGTLPPFPFMRPAWEVNKGGLLPKFVAGVGPKIENRAEQLARQNQGALLSQVKK